MTTTDPDQIRQEIERTRAGLAGDVDALTDKVSPNRIVSRRVDRVRGSFSNAKERVMGTASDAYESVGDTAGTAAEAVRDKAQGSPLAVGLIAFGAGVLISSLLPASRAEQRIAGQVKETVGEHSEELKAQATRIGEEVREHLREPAQQAVDSVKATASDAADTVREQGRSSAQDLQDQAKQARDNVTNR